MARKTGIRSGADNFSGKFGVIAATAGSAVGLGNIWRFPYITGENGGGAFLLLYMFFVLVIGIPAMMSEFVIGRRSGSNALDAFKKLTPGKPWWLIGLMGIVAAFVILAFYSTVSGWSVEYIIQSVKGGFTGKDMATISNDFETFCSGSFYPVLWQLLFMAITAGVVIAGINKGIEKATKILMPMLLVLIICVCIRSLTLPGASAGMRFLFEPKFEDLSFQGVLMALGQAAFSLSIGMGALITYGSYIRRDTPLFSTSVNIAIADTAIAILSSIMIFPALFSMGAESVGGPTLVFITLPSIFQQMAGGYVCSIIFFILLAVAALTSTISVLEVVVAFMIERFKMSRLKAAIISSLSISAVGVLCTLSFGPLKDATIFGMTFFDFANYLSANVLLTFGALFIIIYTGWILGKKNFIDEINKSGRVSPKLTSVIIFFIRYVAPIGIGAVAVGAFFFQGLT